MFPEDIQTAVRVYYDSTAKRVCAEEQTIFRDLPLAARKLEPPPAGEAASLLAAEVMQGRIVMKEWDHSVEQWVLRINSLARWCPELQLSPIDEEARRHVIEQICHGSFSARDVKGLEVRRVVRSWLSDAQHQALDKHAPERLEMPNGRNPKVTYVADGQPFVALRIQELFGVTTTPKIAMGRTPVLIHILAPSMRPVQITQDLAGFWKEHYPRVKQELQRKYPKHEWR